MEAEGSVTPRIFLSYRREDSAAYTGRLSDALTLRFGDSSVFMDVDTIASGSDFAEVIQAAVEGCDVLRDVERRAHPSLVPWAELSEVERDKDRETVREVPAFLARIGYAVIRKAPSAEHG